jgi:CAAX protease family protein
MHPDVRYEPVRFYLLTYCFSWLPWIAAAWCSFRPGLEWLDQLLMLAGLLGPLVSALVCLRRERRQELWRDFKDRLVNLQRLNWRYLPVTFLLMPAAAIIAIRISLSFGRSATQFALIPNLLAMVPLMFLAPTLEELGWRGYGVDALRARFGMWPATLLFAALWAIWHVPLFFINHTYQHDLLLLSPVYVANFFVSVIPAAIIANWLYYKHRRSIPAAILFHFMLDAVAEAFRIEQFTKCIVTVVFLAVAILMMVWDRRSFAAGPRDFIDGLDGAHAR